MCQKCDANNNMTILDAMTDLTEGLVTCDGFTKEDEEVLKKTLVAHSDRIYRIANPEVDEK